GATGTGPEFSQSTRDRALVVQAGLIARRARRACNCRRAMRRSRSTTSSESCSWRSRPVSARHHNPPAPPPLDVAPVFVDRVDRKIHELLRHVGGDLLA